MLTFDQFKRLMSFETKGKYCIEIAFSIVGSDKFDRCWMGKLPDRKTKEDTYWFGLTTDGKNAYDYLTFADFCSARVFDGKSLLEIWDDVTIEEINGCDPTKMADMYLSGSGAMEAPQ